MAAAGSRPFVVRVRVVLPPSVFLPSTFFSVLSEHQALYVH